MESRASDTYGKQDVVDKIQMFQSLVIPEDLEDTAQQGSFKNLGILSSLISQEILDLFKCWTESKLLPEATYAFVCRPGQPSAIRCQTGLNYGRVIQKSEMITVNFLESLGRSRHFKGKTENNKDFLTQDKINHSLKMIIFLFIVSKGNLD